MKRVFGLIIGLVAALGFVGQAHAYPPAGLPSITTSSSSPTAGASITLTGNLFCPNTVVTFAANGVTLGQATSNAAGAATLVITAPSTAGPFVVTATAASPCVASATITLAVQAAGGTPGAPGGGIPETGSSTSSSLQYGAVAVGIGAALVAFAGLKRRRPALA